MLVNNLKQSRMEFNMWARMAFLMMFLLMPDDFFKLTSVYHSETLSFIAYKWLDFDFSVLFIFVIFLALANLNKENIFFIFVITFTFLRTIVFYFIGLDNAIQYNSFELQLSLLSGWALFHLAYRWREKYLAVDNLKLFEYFCWIHLASQILGMMLSVSGFSGRYNAINLDVEMTSFIYSVYILLPSNIQNRYGTIKKLIFLIGILLTGARIALIWLLVIILAKSIYGVVRTTKLTVKRTSFAFVVLLIFTLPFILISGIGTKFIGALSGILRFLDMLSGNSDGSGSGRIRSIIAGFQILKENYWGLDCSYIILQKHMVNLGYPTFPHSYLLISRIVYGPFIFLTGLLHFGRKVAGGIKKKNVEVASLFFLVLYFITTGSPLINFKTVFMFLWVFELVLNCKPNDIKNSSYEMEQVRSRNINGLKIEKGNHGDIDC